MGVVEKFFEAKQELCDYFGYVEDWKDIPFRDFLEDEWVLTQNENGSGWIGHGSKVTFETLDAGKEFYSATIYTQRFLPKWVYRGKDFTMVCMDTHCDDNKYFGIFRNDKEVQMTEKMKTAKYANCGF